MAPSLDDTQHAPKMTRNGTDRTKCTRIRQGTTRHGNITNMTRHGTLETCNHLSMTRNGTARS